MKQLFNIFFDICLLRAGPQDVPVSRYLLPFILVLHVLIGVILGLVSYPAVTAMAYGVTNTFVMILFVHGVLVLKKLPARFTQTLSATAGTDVLIGVVAWPVSHWMVTARDSGGDVGAPVLLWLLLVLWSLTVVAHILRNALSVPLAAAIILAILYFFIGYNVSITLFEPLPVQ